MYISKGRDWGRGRAKVNEGGWVRVTEREKEMEREGGREGEKEKERERERERERVTSSNVVATTRSVCAHADYNRQPL